MSKANFNIAKAITLLSEVISEAAAIVPPRTLDVFGNEIDPEDDEPVAASEYAERCNESEDFSNDVTDTLDQLKDEIDQVLNEQDDNEFAEPAWSSMDDEFDDDDTDDDAEDDDDEKADDDDAVQEELPLGDKTDDDTETPFTLDAETYDTMLNAYTELEERKDELARCLESASESISGILEDAETFRRGLDKTGLDQT